MPGSLSLASPDAGMPTSLLVELSGCFSSWFKLDLQKINKASGGPKGAIPRISRYLASKMGAPVPLSYTSEPQSTCVETFGYSSFDPKVC